MTERMRRSVRTSPLCRSQRVRQVSVLARQFRGFADFLENDTCGLIDQGFSELFFRCLSHYRRHGGYSWGD